MSSASFPHLSTSPGEQSSSITPACFVPMWAGLPWPVLDGDGGGGGYGGESSAAPAAERLTSCVEAIRQSGLVQPGGVRTSLEVRLVGISRETCRYCVRGVARVSGWALWVCPVCFFCFFCRVSRYRVLFRCAFLLISLCTTRMRMFFTLAACLLSEYGTPQSEF